MKKLFLIPLALISFNSLADCGEGECKYYPSQKSPEPNLFISREKAAQIAADAVGGGFVKDVDLERGFGSPYYEVEVIDSRGREYEVNINAKTGRVISKRRDY